jgi:hypothetical protein
MQRLRWPPAAPGRYAFVQAADAGVGMAPEIKEKIFEAFFTTKEKGKGTGLGLSAVQDLARESDGFVLLNSEPGKGTEVKVFLRLRGGAHATTVDDDRSVLLSEEALVGGQTKGSARKVVVESALSKAVLTAQLSCSCFRNECAKPHRMAVPVVRAAPPAMLSLAQRPKTH